jgi:hypothetical protein
MADPVQLTDLDVITRYSIAVRTATADRGELIETLRADLSWLERGHRRAYPAETPDAALAEVDTELVDAEVDSEGDSEAASGSALLADSQAAPDREPAQAGQAGQAKKPAAKKASPKRAPVRQAAKKPVARKTATRPVAGRKTVSRRAR